MIVTAPEEANDFGKKQHSQPVKPNVAKRGTNDIADKDDVSATFCSRQTSKAPGLPHAQPVMRKVRDRACIGHPVNRKQHHTTPPASYSLSDGEGQSPSAANDRKRGLACARSRVSLLH